MTVTIMVSVWSAVPVQTRFFIVMIESFSNSANQMPLWQYPQQHRLKYKTRKCIAKRKATQLSYLLCIVLRRCRLISQLCFGWRFALQSWDSGCRHCIVLSQLHGWDEGCDTKTALMPSNLRLDNAVLWSRSNKPTTCPSIVVLEAWSLVVSGSSECRHILIVIATAVFCYSQTVTVILV
jgi:hypothetical protein